MKQVTRDELIAAYIITQEGDLESVDSQLRNVQKHYPTCTHFVVYECADLSSSQAGNKVIMPVGPDNTFKSLDTLPKLWSPRGLASDMSVPILYCEV